MGFYLTLTLQNLIHTFDPGTKNLAIFGISLPNKFHELFNAFDICRCELSPINPTSVHLCTQSKKLYVTIINLYNQYKILENFLYVQKIQKNTIATSFNFFNLTKISCNHVYLCTKQSGVSCNQVFHTKFNFLV
jgi:hypothetical protein